MRLIDADSVKKGIEELKQSPWYNEKNLDHFPIRKEAVEVVEHLCIDKEPTIDAAPVVRCGNCAKMGKNGKGIPGGCPFGMTDDTCDPNAYCSYGVLSMKTGERRTND